jgi:hypothetical protein
VCDVISAGQWGRGVAAMLVTLALLIAPARADEPAGEAAYEAPTDEPAAPSGEGSPDLSGAEEGAADEEGEPLHPADQYGGMVFDAMVLRPLGFGGVLVGFAAYLVSVPIAAPGGNLAASWELFFQGPFDYTFVRPLGEF